MNDTDEIELPRSIMLLWGHAEPQRRGPKPGLSLERIAAAAIRLADAEGLGAVSMSRVAGELGFTTMSLYRYVSGKDDLIVLMLDVAIGRPDFPANAPQGWRVLLERWSLEYLNALRRHPWMTRVSISGPPITPNNVAWMEYALSAMSATTLTAQEKLSVLLLLTNYVRGIGQLLVDIAGAERAIPPGQTAAMSQYGQILSQLIDADRFPALCGILASGALDDDDDDPDAEFHFGLRRVLDGIAVLIH